jgi:uncharacterized protein (TIGR02145 family)
MNNTNGSTTNPSGVQGVCPAGWHLPSDAEWKELEMELGMSQNEADNTDWRGTNEGDALKSSSNWNGNNSTGFSALNGGYRYATDPFNGEGVNGSWWSTTEDGLGAYRRRLGSAQSGVDRYSGSKGYGYSVRCVKD